MSTQTCLCNAYYNSKKTGIIWVTDYRIHLAKLCYIMYTTVKKSYRLLFTDTEK